MNLLGNWLILGVLTLLQLEVPLGTCWGEQDETAHFWRRYGSLGNQKACAGLLPCSRLAWLTGTHPVSSSMVHVSTVGHAFWLVMLLFAISLLSWIRAATDCWRVPRSSSLWWTSFVLLSPSSWQYAATGSQPWPSRPPQCPACMLSQRLTSLPAAGPTFPPQLAAAPYCGNYYLLWIFLYIMCPESSTVWITTRVPLCRQEHAATHSCSTLVFTRLSHREALRGKEWRWLLAPLSTIWCDMYSLSCVTWIQQQHSWVQKGFSSTLLSMTGLLLFLLFSKKHLRCFPKVMAAAQSQFNSLLLWIQILIGFRLLSWHNALRPQHGYMGYNFCSCFSPPLSSLGFSVHAGSFVHASFSMHFTLPPHPAFLKISPPVKNRGTFNTHNLVHRQKHLDEEAVSMHSEKYGILNIFHTYMYVCERRVLSCGGQGYLCSRRWSNVKQ